MAKKGTVQSSGFSGRTIGKMLQQRPRYSVSASPSKKKK